MASLKSGKSYVVVTNYCNNNTQPSIQLLIVVSQVLDVYVRKLLVPLKTKKNERKRIIRYYLHGRN